MALNREMFMGGISRKAPMAAPQNVQPPETPAMKAAKGVGQKILNDNVVTPVLNSVFAPAAATAGGTAAGAATAGGAAAGAAGAATAGGAAATGAAAAGTGGMMAAMGPAIAAAAPVAVPLLIAASLFGGKRR